MKTIGLQQFGQMVFDRMPLEGVWKDTIGTPSRNFSTLIYGTSGHGKTTGILRFIKALVDCGMRATYISHEEGLTATMQDAMRREHMLEAYSGRIILAGDASFAETLEYFGKRGSPEIAVIDSIDYCGLTVEEYKELRKKLKNKIIILIAWSQGSRPKTQAAKDIEYMVDVKLFLRNFMIWPKSRFGGNIPQPIWEERARLLEPKHFAELDKRAKKTLFNAENTNEDRGVSA